MSLDGKMLAKAKTALEEIRRKRDREYERRLAVVYSKAPRVRALDAEIRATMQELVGSVLAPGSGRIADTQAGSMRADTVPSDEIRAFSLAADGIRRRNLELQEERRGELQRAGFTDAYIDDGYMCPVCHDTGFTIAGICGCLMRIYKDVQRESLNDVFKMGGGRFEDFDHTLYADTSSAYTDISPRRNMEYIYTTCLGYARKFGMQSVNLFFNGAPGLGKTFMSACIARMVAESGHSVVYEMAAAIINRFEDARFSRGEDSDAARSDVKRFLECDLLIIDDLGTEMNTALTIGALYEVINTRLVTNRKMIVVSNLTLPEMRRRYTEQIMSRLEGEYQTLTFYGDDIRKKRNNI